MKWLVIFLTVACAKFDPGPAPAPGPKPAEKCYLLDNDGGYLLDENGQRLTCD